MIIFDFRHPSGAGPISLANPGSRSQQPSQLRAEQDSNQTVTMQKTSLRQTTRRSSTPTSATKSPARDSVESSVAVVNSSLSPSTDRLVSTQIIDMIVMNVDGRDPITVRRQPEYPSVSTGSKLKNRETAKVTERRLVRHRHTDGQEYDVYHYKLADSTGWLADFNPFFPLVRNLEPVAYGLPIERVRALTGEFGLRELAHDSSKMVLIYEATGRMVRVMVYYSTGTVSTVRWHPRQGMTEQFRKNVDFDGLRVILQEGFNSSREVKQSEVVGKVTSFVTLDEQAALLRQLRVLDAEVAAIAEEQATIVALLERYEQEQNSSQRRAAAYETHQRRKSSPSA